MRKDRWVLPFFKQYRGALALALFLGILTYAFSSALMFNSGYLISKAAEAPGNIMAIYLPVALARIFGVGKPLLHYLERLTSHDWVLRMSSSLRLKLYDALEKDAIFLKQRLKTGDVLGLLAEDIGHIQNLYLRSIFPLIVAWILYVLVIVFLGFFSLWFALAMLLLLGVIVLLVPLVSALTNGARQLRRKAMKNARYEQVTDNILGVSDWVIAQRGKEYVEVDGASEEALRRVDAELNRSDRNRALLLQVLYGLAILALVAWAGVQFGTAGGGAMSAEFGGTANWIAAFVLGFFPLIEVFAPLPRAAIEVQKYRDSIDRLEELPHEQDEVVRLSKELEAPLTITIEQATLRYPDASYDVLDKLDLALLPGQKTAILGRSGSGKSSLAALIRGDLAPTSGSVCINGVRTCEFGDDITRYVGVIQQQTYLFNATIAENLRIGNPRASDEELWEVLEKVGLRGMVERLAKGLTTMVDEAGLRFSGGERHRIALARVLLQQVPIVILDEPTVGLDPASEQALLNTIFATMEGKTVILITHHLQGVSLMDNVVFIEEGRLKLQGSPEELSRSNAYYQSLQAFDKGISV